MIWGDQPMIYILGTIALGVILYWIIGILSIINNSNEGTDNVGRPQCPVKGPIINKTIKDEMSDHQKDRRD